MAQQSQVPDFTCPRCNGTGEIKACRHVRAGICFECWGTKKSFRLQERHLQATLEGLRTAYRRARSSGHGRDTLSAITHRGLKAARALEAFQQDAKGHVENCKVMYA